MDRIGLAGLTLNETDVAGLERVRQSVGTDHGAFMRELADELAASEIVLLATCNRFEVAYARESGHLPGPRDHEIIARAWGVTDEANVSRPWFRTGRNAVHHVLRVASSLDSLVLGEDQILAQVRHAFEAGQELGLVGGLLTPVYEAAIQVGKQVRTDTDLSRHPVSVVSVGVQHLAASLSGHPTAPRLALIGAGRMGSLLARSVRDAGLTVALVVNRTRSRAEELAAALGATALDLDAFQSSPPALDGLISATSCPEPVLDADQLRRLGGSTPSGRPLVAVDLAVPRDLATVDDPSVELIDLDALRALADQSRQRRQAAARTAEEIVERKLEQLLRRVSDQRVAGVMAETLAETQDLFSHELARLLEGRLAHLGDTERRSVERWARSTFGRLAYVPMRAFKDLAAERAALGASPGSNGHNGHNGAPGGMA